MKQPSMYISVCCCDKSTLTTAELSQLQNSLCSCFALKTILFLEIAFIISNLPNSVVP